MDPRDSGIRGVVLRAGQSHQPFHLLASIEPARTANPITMMHEMRVGIYARVSTQDKDYDPERKLLPLLEFCRAPGAAVAGEFVDYASATEDRRRMS